MKRLFSTFRVWLVVAACIPLLPGCKKESAKLVPVAGKVTLKGQPITAGQVSLIPLSKDEKTAGISSGAIDSDGSYKILTNGKDGAPLGKYRVTVTPPMMPAPEGKKGPMVPFNKAYMNTTNTPLEIEVVASPVAGAYDLKLTK
jgi:hypothetical protein